MYPPLDTYVSHPRYLARDPGDSAEGIQSSSAGFWGWWWWSLDEPLRKAAGILSITTHPHKDKLTI